ncbi:MAG: hypothetical protein M1834_002915 [Cirrosporium novae-zelandiae]|nr:MAG: hypothetical protein M1834_002915 [Cirrosporium novae-zelandiae]
MPNLNQESIPMHKIHPFGVKAGISNPENATPRPQRPPAVHTLSPSLSSSDYSTCLDTPPSSSHEHEYVPPRPSTPWPSVNATPRRAPPPMPTELSWDTITTIRSPPHTWIRDAEPPPDDLPPTPTLMTMTPHTSVNLTGSTRHGSILGSWQRPIYRVESAGTLLSETCCAVMAEFRKQELAAKRKRTHLTKAEEIEYYSDVPSPKYKSRFREVRQGMVDYKDDADLATLRSSEGHGSFHKNQKWMLLAMSMIGIGVLIGVFVWGFKFC